MRRTLTAAVIAALSGTMLLSVQWGSIPAADASPLYVSNPTTLVNPFIGTANGGDTFPGADLPFGMVQWSPDTPSRPDGGGYFYGDSSIIGYSLTHLSGPGCQAEGDVPILPTVGAIGRYPINDTEPFVHSDETATPGYYQLDAGGVNTQLSTTMRSGMAVFTYPSTAASGNLLFKMSDSATPVTASQFNVVNDKEVDGWVTTGQFCGAAAYPTNTYTMYFDMVFSRSFVSDGAWTRDGNGDWLRFDTASNPVVQAKVGISYVSTSNAVLNRTDEDPGWNFNSVRTAAQKSWEAMLSKVQVGGGTSSEQSVFYTALYHSLLEPNVFSDVNGQYMGYDGEVQHVTAAQTAEYANYSGWDIYRSEIPLEALLAPQQTSDIVTSMLNDYAQTGQLPKWSEDGGETYIMVGDPADAIIADAYAFGARGFDTGLALKDMVAEADVPNNIRPGLSSYMSDGYLPADATYGCCNFYGPVSTQEEYNTADNAIALLATALGKPALAQTFATRAQSWQNVFNPESGFLQPKNMSGLFASGFDPTSQDGFVEADAYVYTAMIPFDLQGIINAEGGDAAWVSFLNGLTSSVTAMGASQIQMGDEPSFDIPWEYDYAGDPSATESVVREIQDQLYTDTPAGLAGNDDLGAMSSWYVWSALGGYPEMPGSATVALGSPLFPDIAFHLADGKTITEVAPGAADTAPYVQSLTLNQKSWAGSYLPAGIFAKGGTVVWTLGAAPNATWGTGAADAPPSDVEGLLPALGYLSDPDNADAVVNPGGETALTLGVENTSDADEQISWAATAPSGSGIEIGQTSGNLTVPNGGRSTQQIDIQASPSSGAGDELVTFTLQTASGAALPDVVAEVDVT